MEYRSDRYDTEIEMARARSVNQLGVVAVHVVIK